MPFPFLLVLAIPVILAVVIGLLAWKTEQRRRDRWAADAQRRGWRFAAKPGSDLPLPDFKLFTRGHGRRMRNVMLGSLDGASLLIADYQYTTGGGKNSSTHRQSIAVVQDGGLSLPSSFLRVRVTGFDALGRWFGGQDINFDDDPAFSKAFVLQGEDEEAIRARFRPELRAWFLAHRTHGLQFETRAGRFLIHRGRRIKPDALPGLIDEIGELRAILAEAEAGG